MPSPRDPLISLLRPYAWMVPAAALLGAVGSVLEGIGIGLLVPLIGFIFGGAAPSALPPLLAAVAAALASLSPEQRVLAIGGVIAAVIACKGVVQASGNVLLAWIEGHAGDDLRNALSERILKLRYAFFMTHDPGRLVNAISTDSWYAVEALRAAMAAISSAAALAVFGAILVWLDWRLFLIALFGVGAVALIVQLPKRRLQAIGRAISATNHALARRMLVIVEGMLAIRLFNQQERESAHFADASGRVRDRIVASQKIVAFVGPISEVIVALVTLVILYACYRLNLTIGETTAYLVLLARAEPHARQINQARVKLAAVRGSVEEMRWLLDQPVEDNNSGERPDPGLAARKIVFHAVSFDYPNGTPGLREASFTIRPGAATALLGRSGAGKTTVVGLLARLMQPDKGSISAGGRDISGLSARAWRAGIAIAGQNVELIEGTIADNIAYAWPDADTAAIEEAARAAHAHDFIAALGQGYATRLGSDGLNLSGGERQRIGLARALLTRPDLLILDEATSAIDAETERAIVELLGRREFFSAALVISHRRSTLAACDDGVVLAGGRVSEAGPLAGLSYFRELPAAS